MFGSDSCQTFFCFFLKQLSWTAKDFHEELHETIGQVFGKRFTLFFDFRGAIVHQPFSLQE